MTAQMAFQWVEILTAFMFLTSVQFVQWLYTGGRATVASAALFSEVLVEIVEHGGAAVHPCRVVSGTCYLRGK